MMADARRGSSERRTRPPLWVVEGLDVVERRRLVLLAVTGTIVVLGALLAWLAPGIVPPRAGVGAAIAVAALLLGLAAAVAIDATDLYIRGPRHVSAAGGELVAVLSQSATSEEAVPLAAAVFEAREPGQPLLLGLAASGKDTRATVAWTDALATALEAEGASVLRIDLASGTSEPPGLAEVVLDGVKLAGAVTFGPEPRLARLGAGGDHGAALDALTTLPGRLPRDLDVLLVALPMAASRQVVGAVRSLDHVLIVAQCDRTSRVELIAGLDALEAAGTRAQVALVDEQTAARLGGGSTRPKDEPTPSQGFTAQSPVGGQPVAGPVEDGSIGGAPAEAGAAERGAAEGGATDVGTAEAGFAEDSAAAATEFADEPAYDEIVTPVVDHDVAAEDAPRAGAPEHGAGPDGAGPDGAGLGGVGLDDAGHDAAGPDGAVSADAEPARGEEHEGRGAADGGADAEVTGDGEQSDVEVTGLPPVGEASAPGDQRAADAGAAGQQDPEDGVEPDQSRPRLPQRGGAGTAAAGPGALPGPEGPPTVGPDADHLETTERPPDPDATVASDARSADLLNAAAAAAALAQVDSEGSSAPLHFADGGADRSAADRLAPDVVAPDVAVPDLSAPDQKLSDQGLSDQGLSEQPASDQAATDPRTTGHAGSDTAERSASDTAERSASDTAERSASDTAGGASSETAGDAGSNTAERAASGTDADPAGEVPDDADRTDELPRADGSPPVRRVDDEHDDLLRTTAQLSVLMDDLDDQGR